MMTNNTDAMNLFIFKTDIRNKKRSKAAKAILNQITSIQEWSIDSEDIDHVLRIEATEDLNENELIHVLKTCGIQCQVLTD